MTRNHMTAHAPATVALLLLAVSAAACNTKHDANYCPDRPHQNCLNDASSDGPKTCTTAQECSAPTSVCDSAGSMTCVECTANEAAACVGQKPACSAEHQCRACVGHLDCSSSACLPDGSCAAETDVAYVAPGGSGSTCTKASPCLTLDKGILTNKPYVKIAAGLVKDNKLTTIDGRAVTILCDPGATLDRDGDGAIIEIRSAGADVRIFDLVVTGATGIAGGDGLDLTPNGGTPKLTLVRTTITANQGTGISATGGSLAVSQSTITGNLGGGLAVSGTTTTFDINATFITYNGLATGAQASQTGGAAITSNTTGSRFEWNTVAFNQSSGLTFRGGVSCNAPLVASAGNLLFHNTEADGVGGTKTDSTTQRNLAGGCQFGNTVSVPLDSTNLGFKAPLVAPFDFHLTATSPASIVDAAGLCTGVDVDRQSRPIGAACDFGADEFKP